MTRITAIASLLSLILIVSACTGEPGPVGAIGSGDAAAPATSDGTSDTGSSGASLLGDIPTDPYVESSTRAVVTAADLQVFDGPGGNPLTTLAPTTSFGTVRVLLVEEAAGDWLKVRLPSRPNHRSGWISADDVRVEGLDLSVYVDLTARTLAVRSGNETLVASPVAIGSDENPTPTGTFYITDKLETPDPDGGYGPYAFGLSGHSETLTEFAGGDGQIGIHGTNDPTSIGQAVSHGCLRLANDVIEELATMLPLGTPVHIV